MSQAWKATIALGLFIGVLCVVVLVASPDKTEPPESHRPRRNMDYELQTALNRTSVIAYITETGITVTVDTDVRGARIPCSMSMLRDLAQDAAMARLLRDGGYTALLCASSTIRLNRTW